jgi:hypothetical protein
VDQFPQLGLASELNSIIVDTIQNRMRTRVLFIVMAVSVTFSWAQKTFNEATFFAAIASEDLSLVDNQITSLKRLAIKERDAYVGALMMKKAGLVSPIRTKLNLFKEGHAKLQQAIKKDPTNGTYRFLRLIIQENAPGILNYNDDIKEDSRFVNQVFDTLSPVVKNAALDYGKRSKALRIHKLASYSSSKT